jgi:hypothetical protein
VLSGSGQRLTWLHFPDRFEEDMPAADPALTPPPGLRQPVRRFGKAWVEDLGRPAAPTSWAVGEERGVEGSLQDCHGGIVLRFLWGERLVLPDSSARTSP